MLPLPALPCCACAAAAAEAADVLICGDFNSHRQDSPCWLLRQGRLERNHTDAICPQARYAALLPARSAPRQQGVQLSSLASCAHHPPSPSPWPQVPVTNQTIAHPFALHDAYEAGGLTGGYYTHRVGPQASVLDFIWASRHMAVVALMRPLQQELRPLVDRCWLPSRWHPSDHLPVAAVLRLGPAAAVAAAAGGGGGSGGSGCKE